MTLNVPSDFTDLLTQKHTNTSTRIQTQTHTHKLLSMTQRPIKIYTLSLDNFLC